MSELAAVAAPSLQLGIHAMAPAPMALPAAVHADAAADSEAALAESVPSIVGATADHARQLVEFPALLRALAGDEAPQPDAAPADQRRADRGAAEQPEHRDDRKVAIAAAPVWLAAGETVRAELPVTEPASRAPIEVAGPARAHDVGQIVSPAPAEPLKAAAAVSLPAGQPPAGLKVTEEPPNAVAARMPLAFALGVERQSAPTPNADGKPHAPGRSESPQPGEASRQPANPSFAVSKSGVQATGHPKPLTHAAPAPDAGGAEIQADARSSRPEAPQRIGPHPEPVPTAVQSEPARVERPPSVPGEQRMPARPEVEANPTAVAQPGAAARLEATGAGEPKAAQAPQPAAGEPRRPEPSAHEISLRVEGDPVAGRARSAVAVHVVERAGRIEIRVRSADPELNQWLRRDVPVLMHRLEAEGFRGEILAAGPEAGPGAPELPRLTEPQAWPAPDREGSRGGAREDADARQHQQRSWSGRGHDEAGPSETSAFRRLHDGFLS